MKNYICINGKKAELTEEQMKALGIEIPKAKNPFDRVELSKGYNCITGTGKVIRTYDMDDVNDRECHKVGNYCTDASLLQQRALHETLSRLLWRYSMEHDGDKIQYGKDTSKFLIYQASHGDWDVVVWSKSTAIGVTYFDTRETAINAIEEIIKPFMAQHPEFKF